MQMRTVVISLPCAPTAVGWMQGPGPSPVAADLPMWESGARFSAIHPSQRRFV